MDIKVGDKVFHATRIIRERGYDNSDPMTFRRRGGVVASLSDGMATVTDDQGATRHIKVENLQLSQP